MVEPEVTSGDYLQGFLLGTRQALHENGRESITITIKEVSPFSVGLLIAFFERAVGLYASLININAYHQPGVEAGKKAAAAVIDLQRKVLQLSDREARPCPDLVTDRQRHRRSRRFRNGLQALRTLVCQPGSWHQKDQRQDSVRSDLSDDLRQSAISSFAGMFVYPKKYDVIVVGAGHAGVEAALGRRPDGLPDPAADHQRRHHRPDVLQSRHRRFGQGTSGPGD